MRFPLGIAHKSIFEQVPEAIISAVGEKAIVTTSFYDQRERRQILQLVFHTSIVLSSLPEASHCPHGENLTQFTQSVCCVKVEITDQVSIHHTFTLLSLDPEAKNFPQLEKHTDLTVFEWPQRVRMQTGPSHTLIVLSFDPEAISLPSGLKSTDVTLSTWPLIS